MFFSKSWTTSSFGFTKHCWRSWFLFLTNCKEEWVVHGWSHLPWEVPIKGCSNKIIGYHFLSKIGRIQVHELEKPEILKYLLKMLNPRTAGFWAPQQGPQLSFFRGCNGLCWFRLSFIILVGGCQFTQAVHSFIWLFHEYSYTIEHSQELVG